MKKLNILLLTILISFNAFAYEVVDVCATYSNTGKNYAVQGNIYKGSELNSETNSFNYMPLSTYVVIFWSNEQASVIKLDSYYGTLFHYGTSGQDQRGYPWTIKKGHTYCW